MNKQHRQCKSGLLIAVMVSSLMASAASQATVSAVLALKPHGDMLDELLMAVEEQALSNCKHLVAETFGIVMIHLECNTPEDMKAALATEILPIQALQQSSVWIDQSTP